jgi:uncharacterized membrane protein YgcG
MLRALAVLFVCREFLPINHAITIRVHTVEAAVTAIGMLTVIIVLVTTLHVFIAVIIVIFVATVPVFGTSHAVVLIRHAHTRAIAAIRAGHLAPGDSGTGGEQGKDGGGSEKGFHVASPG